MSRAARATAVLLLVAGIAVSQVARGVAAAGSGSAAGGTTGAVCDFCVDHPDSCSTAGQYCPPSVAYPKKCPPQYYCPSLGVKVLCPEGFFCREGSAQPVPCQPLTVCPAGTQSPTKGFVGLLFNLVLVLVGYLGFQLYKYCRDKKREERARRFDNERLNPMHSSRRRLSNIRSKFSKYDPALIDLEFQGLSYYLPDGTCILRKVSGKFMHGRLIAIMGPSGAGKTTLLRVLAGRLTGSAQLTRGRIFVNGNEASLSSFRQLVGYVPQEDIIMGNLTVKENIRYSALSRLPSNWTRPEKLARANDVIDMLELHEVRHSKVGDESDRGVSGGQKKRVNIGLELVANPSMLFLDEPTSGLDSTAAKHVMRSLKYLADSGITVVCVVHQPRYEIFELFDDLCLLARGGELAYLGPVKEAVPYFVSLGYTAPRAQVNSADWMIDVVSGDARGPGEAPPTRGSSFLEEFSDEARNELRAAHNARPSRSGLSALVRQSSIAEADEKDDDDTPSAPTTPVATAPASNGGSSSGGPDLEAGKAAEPERPPFYKSLPSRWRARHAAMAAAEAKAAEARQQGSGGEVIAPSRQQVPSWGASGVRSAMRRASVMLGIRSTSDDARQSLDALTKDRPMPGFWMQLLVFTVRSINQQVVNIVHLATDLFLVCAAGAILGIVYYDTDDDSSLLQTLSLSCLVIGMTAITSSERWFYKEVSVYLREQAVGCSSAAYVMAKFLGHMPLIFLSPAVYLTFYYTFSAPRATLTSYYFYFLLVQLVGTGVGYCVPLLFKGRAQLAGVVFPLVCTMFSGVSPSLQDLANMQFIGTATASLSYSRWAVELLFLANAERRNAALFRVADSLQTLQYSWATQTNGVLILLAMAVFFRLLTYLLLRRIQVVARRR